MNDYPADHVRSTVERAVLNACLLEVCARKPGNVHPQCGFDDMSFRDFVTSARAIAPILSRATPQTVGQTIFEAVEQTREQVGKNTNLGMILLLAPLAVVSPETSLRAGIGPVLDGLTREDALWTYRAIRLAAPGGMGEVASQDLADEPTGTLLEVMRLAAERDRIAAQYASQYELIFDFALPRLCANAEFSQSMHWELAVIGLFLELLAAYPDTLIARKCDQQTAAIAAEKARQILASGWPETDAGYELLSLFDIWLRKDGHRRNPGTTADLVAATLFVAFRDGHLQCPPWETILTDTGLSKL